MAAGDGEHPRPDHVGVSVGRARGIAFVRYVGGEQLGDPAPPLGPGKQQDPTIRRQPSAVEPGAQSRARDG